MPDAGRRPSLISAGRVVEIFQKELSDNCKNTAVVGGLDVLIRNASRTLPKLTPPAGWRYAGLPIPKRQKWVDAAIRILQSPGTGIGAQNPPPIPQYPRPPQKGSQQSTKPNFLALDAPVSQIKYFPKRYASQLKHIGISTVKDALWTAPARYEDHSQMFPINTLKFAKNGIATVAGQIVNARVSHIGGPPGATVAVVKDDTGSVEVVWFKQAYLAAKLKPGQSIVLSGDVSLFRGIPKIVNPEFETASPRMKKLTHAGTLLPVYPTTEGLRQRTLRTVTRQAINASAKSVNDWLPMSVREAEGLPPINDAIEEMHYPQTEGSGERARQRLAFDEVFLMQMSALKQRREWRIRRGSVTLTSGMKAAEHYIASLGFQLTTDQRRVLDDILADMSSKYPMSRLLQGEVGSGKTVVALAAMVAAAAAGKVGALLAPTEVLAEQHFMNACRQLDAKDVGITDTLAMANIESADNEIGIGLLTGNFSAQRKRWMQSAIAAGKAQIVIGTHALFQDAVEIPDLALVVVDEQHRFGVEQRNILAERTPRPHVLAMSATPIPRTLRITIFGDLDMSTLRCMPHGSRPVKTEWARTPEGRAAAYELIRQQVAQSRQAFIVCPFIEDSQVLNARAAITEYERLKSEIFPDLKIGLLHGRMSLGEKQRAMSKFREGKTSILVATPVIEVGVDIPNAGVMLIESADRFGMAQLHQLRGRIGRDGRESWCVALTDDPEAGDNPRLKALVRYNDGFQLAETDLKMRGPGDYVGTRQSGWPMMKIAKPWDLNIMIKARNAAKDLLERDPSLSLQENQALKAVFHSFEEQVKVQPA